MSVTLRLFLSLLICASGLVTLLGALLQWPWFVNSPKYLKLARSMGKPGARVLHVVLGLLAILFGILIYQGVIPL
jgi:uncharacterized membrane protein YphA (DoxX/SURF4 family)